MKKEVKKGHKMHKAGKMPDGLKAMLMKGKKSPMDRKMSEEKAEAKGQGDKMAESRGMHDDKKPVDKKAAFLANMAHGKKAHKGMPKMSDTMAARMKSGMKGYG